MSDYRTIWEFVQDNFPNYNGDMLVKYSQQLNKYNSGMPEVDIDLKILYEAFRRHDVGFRLDHPTALFDNREDYKRLGMVVEQYIDGLIYKIAIAEYIQK